MSKYAKYTPPSVFEPPARQLNYEFAPGHYPTPMYHGIAPPVAKLLDTDTSVVKLDQMLCLYHPRGCSLFEVGDILRVQFTIGNKPKLKDIIILHFSSNGIGNPSSWTLAIPPQGHQKSQPDARPDIVIQYHSKPNPNSPTSILNYLGQVETKAIVQNGWKTISVLRKSGSGSDLEELGTLWDIRQAQAFASSEIDFTDQFAFLRGTRKRRWNHKKFVNLPGWYLADNSGLYFKLRESDYARYNKRGMLDFGNDLNNLLASCADVGFAIVPYDMRMLLQCEGVPGPNIPAPETSILTHGPMSFPTAYTRELAGDIEDPSVWSMGHAHLGPLSFGKFPIGKATGTHTLKGVQVLDKDPMGVVMTDLEKQKIDAFHHNYVQGRILHWPLPIHRKAHNGLDGGVGRKQYYAHDGKYWAEDDRGPGGIWGV